MAMPSDDRDPGEFRAAPKMMGVLSELGERAEYCSTALTDLPLAMQTYVLWQALEE